MKIKKQRLVKIEIEVSAETARAVDRIAKKTNISQSKLCEILIVLYLDKYGL
jgi:predicted transcriptional regulator